MPDPLSDQPATAVSTAPELLALRERIDAVDRELLALLNSRAALALQVGSLKKREGSVVFRPEREAQVISGLKQRNAGPLPNECVAPIWREIMSASRALETPTRVAYLGPAGTFSELAALGYFGSSIVKLPCANGPPQLPTFDSAESRAFTTCVLPRHIAGLPPLKIVAVNPGVASVDE